MAKNWTVSEAVKVIREGKNIEDMRDIGCRFPLFAIAAAGGEAGLVKLLTEGMPEYMTPRKLEAILKGEKEDAEGGEDKKPETDKEEKAEKSDKAEKAEKKDAYAGKSAKELYGLCKERKLEVEPKKDAEFYIKTLKKDDAAKAKADKKADKAEKKDDDWDEKPVEKSEKSEKADKADKKGKKEDEDWDI